MEGVVGVGGKESNDMAGEARLEARCNGRNMPEPRMEVVKYRMLYNDQPCSIQMIRR